MTTLGAEEPPSNRRNRTTTTNNPIRSSRPKGNFREGDDDRAPFRLPWNSGRSVFFLRKNPSLIVLIVTASWALPFKDV